jgi:trans-aconitate methyltransferase
MTRALIAATLTLMLAAAGAAAQRGRQSASEPPAEIPPHLIYLPMDVADRMLADAGVTKADVVYDLGCGDGRVAIMAVTKFGAKAVAVDNNAARIAEARANAEREGVAASIRFVQQNMIDLSDATVVTMSSPQSMAWLGLNGLLNPTLTGQLKPGARIISNFVPGSMKEWKPDRVDHFVDRGQPRAILYLWKVI